LAGFNLQRATLAIDGTAAQKHVLLVLALHLNAETARCDPGVPLLASETGLDQRTVQRSIAALEAAGHLERVMRTGKSTRYILHPRQGATPGTVSPRHGDAAATDTVTPGTVSPKQQGTTIPPKAKPSSGAAAEERVAKTPKKQRALKRHPGSRLTEDWTPPPIGDLSVAVQAMIAKWPPGAFEFVAEKFVNHWLGEGRAIGAKRNWKRTFENWLMGDGAKILRDGQSGFDFSPWAPGRANGERQAPAGAGQDEQLERASAHVLALQESEGEAAATVRAELRRECGARTYDGWLKPTAFAIDGRTVTISGTSEFMVDWIRTHFADRLALKFGQLLGEPVNLTWRVVKPPIAGADHTPAADAGLGARRARRAQPIGQLAARAVAAAQ
jgi:hypothetical protein